MKFKIGETVKLKFKSKELETKFVRIYDIRDELFCASKDNNIWFKISDIKETVKKIKKYKSGIYIVILNNRKELAQKTKKDEWILFGSSIVFKYTDFEKVVKKVKI